MAQKEYCLGCAAPLEEWEWCGRGYCEGCEEDMTPIVGTRVRVKKDIGRIDTVVAITVNNLGTTLFWLSHGGCFSLSEIEVY